MNNMKMNTNYIRKQISKWARL